jgi:hypothetical protein
MSNTTAAGIMQITKPRSNLGLLFVDFVELFDDISDLINEMTNPQINTIEDARV